MAYAVAAILLIVVGLWLKPFQGGPFYDPFGDE